MQQGDKLRWRKGCRLQDKKLLENIVVWEILYQSELYDEMNLVALNLSDKSIDCLFLLHLLVF